MSKIIDFHCHVLPGIDDGSKDVAMSLAMLKESARQGIEVMVATPHFYADRNTPERFFDNRQRAYESLMAEATDELPQLFLAAEVAHFRGIGTSDNIEAFCIQGTKLLLLEMPFRVWSKGDIREVESLLERGITPVMAHIERFYSYQNEMKYMDRLFELPVYIQVNSEALLDWKQRHRVLKLFKAGRAQILGSDCHNLSRRPQNLYAGREILRKKLGKDFLNEMDSFQSELLWEPDNEFEEI